MRRDLGLSDSSARASVREIEPVRAGEVIPNADPEDRMEDILDARGHRY